MVKLALPLDLCGGKDKEEISPRFHPHHLEQAEELPLPLSSYSIWESGPVPSLGSTEE